MRNVSEEFTRLSRADVRPIITGVKMSFPKEFDDSITFFTIEQSAIGGNDFIPGETSVVQEWDKYEYTDYSSRIIAVEWSREVEKFFSVTMAMADIVLDNH